MRAGMRLVVALALVCVVVAASVQGAPEEKELAPVAAAVAVAKAPLPPLPVRLVARLSANAPAELAELAAVAETLPAEEVRARLDALPAEVQATPDWLVFRGSVELALHDAAKACDYLKRACEHPDVGMQQRLWLVVPMMDQEAGREAAHAIILKAREQAPANPLVDYRLSQCLMRMGKYEEGWRAADSVKEKWLKSGDEPIAWLLLESIPCGKLRIDVHYNMGPRELYPPNMGIVRPFSYRIWKTTEEGPELLETIDFEYGMFEGKPMTAAMGITSRRGHANLGMTEVDVKYSVLRKKIQEMVAQRHPEEMLRTEPATAPAD